MATYSSRNIHSMVQKLTEQGMILREEARIALKEEHMLSSNGSKGSTGKEKCRSARRL